MILSSHFFISWWFLVKKTLQLLGICPFSFLSIVRNMSNFCTLVLKKILILIKFPFQWYISCRHLNFDPTYENGHHGDFLPFWKLGIFKLVDHFVVCTKIFLEVIGPYKKVKQEFSLDSKLFTCILWIQKDLLSLYYNLKAQL